MKISVLLLLLIPFFNSFAITHTIEVKNFEYTPALTTIELGDTIKFQWIEGSHPTVSDDGSFTDIAMDILHQQFYLVLTSTGTYAFHCLFHGSTGSGMSGSITVNEPPFECEKPAGLFADMITPASARVNWNAVEGATKYGIVYRSFGTTTWLKKTATTNFKTLPGLSPSTLYQYKIKTICAPEQSGFSPISTFTTAPLKESLIEEQHFNFCYNMEGDVLQIMIHDANDERCNLQLIDVSGKILTESSFQTFGKLHEEYLSLPHLTPGLYLISVANQKQEMIFKKLLVL